MELYYHTPMMDYIARKQNKCSLNPTHNYVLPHQYFFLKISSNYKPLIGNIIRAVGEILLL